MAYLRCASRPVRQPGAAREPALSGSRRPGCAVHVVPSKLCCPTLRRNDPAPQPHVGAAVRTATDKCPQNGRMWLDRKAGRPGGRCQVAISSRWRAGHTGCVRHTDAAAGSRYSRVGVVGASSHGRTRRTGFSHRTTHKREAPMARRDTSPDFIEALARGLDVIRAFQPRQPAMSLAAVAAAAGLARPTARRILLTLEQLGYVRAVA